jgi:glycosyltransferase involved in cell wall biosynthesis
MSRLVLRATGQGAIVGAEWFDDEALSLRAIAVVATGARLFSCHVRPDCQVKILYVTNRLDVGGIETNIVRLAQEFTRRGHTVLVASGKGTLVTEVEVAGARHLDVDINLRNPTHILGAIKELSRILSEEQPDIVHLFSASSAVLVWLARTHMMVASRRRWDGPVISTIMGIHTEAAWRTYSRAFLTCLGASRLVIISPAIDKLVRRLPVSRKRLSHLPVIGVEVPEVIPEEVAHLRQELGLEPSQVVITTIGRLTPYKRHDLFLDAAHLVSLSWPQARFLVVGGGSDEGRLHEQITRLNLDAARLIGERRDLGTILSLSDIYVRPGTAEGFTGITVLEAQVLGVPVIAFETEDVKLAITHRETGWLVASGDVQALAQAIELLLKDKSLRRTVADAGREFVVESFSMPAIVDGLQSFYESELASFTSRHTDSV